MGRPGPADHLQSLLTAAQRLAALPEAALEPYTDWIAGADAELWQVVELTRPAATPAES